MNCPTFIAIAMALQLFVTAPAGWTTSPPAEGARRHDRPDDLYRLLAKDPGFTSVGAVRSGGQHIGSAVLISAEWALTDAHVVSTRDAGTTTPISTEGLVLAFGSTEVAVRSISIHPDYWSSSVPASADIFARRGVDVALVRLVRPVTDVVPAPMSSADPQPPALAALVGYGTSGSALSVIGSPEAAGTKRAGTNFIDQIGGRIGSRDIPSYLLVGDFDGPGMTALSKTGAKEPTDLEFLPVGGDSGGGAFVRAESGWTLVGLFVTSTVQDNDGDKQKGIYGSVFYMTSVAQIRDWIDRTVAKQQAGLSSQPFSR